MSPWTSRLPGGSSRAFRVASAAVSRRSRKATAAMRCLCPLYDTNRRTWIELQPMSIARSGHGAVAAGRCCLHPRRVASTGLT